MERRACSPPLVAFGPQKRSSCDPEGDREVGGWDPDVLVQKSDRGIHGGDWADSPAGGRRLPLRSALLLHQQIARGRLLPTMPHRLQTSFADPARKAAPAVTLCRSIHPVDRAGFTSCTLPAAHQPPDQRHRVPLLGILYGPWYLLDTVCHLQFLSPLTFKHP